MKLFKLVLSFAALACLVVSTVASTQVERHSGSSNGEFSSRKKRSNCADRSIYCSTWKSQGYCNYYKNYCQKTCGFCKVGVPVTGVCRDYNNLCPSYAKNYNYCQTMRYKVWMKTNCPKSCGYCVIKPNPMPTKCYDRNHYCGSWAKKGECRSNPAYMLINCKKSCGSCMTATKKPAPKITTPTPKITTPKSKQACGIPRTSIGRIVGGRFSLPGDWPWHAAIKSCRNCSKLPFCGGTLINDEWVVTAAHCVQNWLASDLYVTIGDTNVLRKSGHEVTMRVKMIYLHNNYAIAAPYDNDVALLHLRQRVTFSRYIRPACLASLQMSMPAPGTNCTVTGFGRISENGPKSARLQQATVPLIDAATCKKAYTKSTITTNMLCAGHANGGIDACKGDSGGPLVCKRSDGSWQLSGIVSWGKGCARKNQFGVYADVKVLRVWIEKTIANVMRTFG